MSNNRNRNRGKSANRKAKAPISALATTVKAMAPTVLVRGNPDNSGGPSAESLRAETLKKKDRGNFGGFVAGMSKAAMRFVPMTDRYFGPQVAAKKKLSKLAKEAGKKNLLKSQPVTKKSRRRSMAKRVFAFIAALSLTLLGYGVYRYHESFGHFPFMQQTLAETKTGHTKSEASAQGRVERSEPVKAKAKTTSAAAVSKSKRIEAKRTVSSSHKTKTTSKSFSRLSEAQKKKIWQEKLAKLKRDRAKHFQKTKAK